MMAKSKVRPPIAKPVFDPEAALRFAAEGVSATGEASAGNPGAAPAAGEVGKASGDGFVSVTVSIREELLQRARAEASRKGRTLDEYIGKLIGKHAGKH